MDSHMMGRYHAQMVRIAGVHERRRMKKEKWRRCIIDKVEKMIQSAEGSAGPLHKITKPTMWRGGVQILKKKTRGCQIVVRRRGKNGQSVRNVTRKYRICKNKPWRNEELEEFLVS